MTTATVVHLYEINVNTGMAINQEDAMYSAEDLDICIYAGRSYKVACQSRSWLRPASLP